ncbi:MAG: L-histidine N(alpha)-methyltransferase [Deltaproteobacteria bacterium]|jgi:dimethylhistidine N-methyltransferase|nr:L-histidine N(alpha)-methyltransferase [Deltaproteobacteria bacterium]
MSAPDEMTLTDLEPERAQFLAEALAGLRKPRKEFPCKYFYDERGSRLFEEICELPEYYPTRTELGIMRSHGHEMAAVLGPRCRLVEFGSGSSEKTRLLLDQLESPAGYVPVDISREHLLRAAADLARDYPEIEILPVCADFTRPIRVPRTKASADRTAVYFPGSTIGNFTHDAARELLAAVHGEVGPGGILLIGVDLVKEPALLESAYDDAAGVTAAFNKNVLVRLNEELGADFDLDLFAHRAVWVPDPGRIEMHLVSLARQGVRLGDEVLCFEEKETICTEYSHKHTLAGFSSIADDAGFDTLQVWTDPERLFSVQALQAK